MDKLKEYIQQNKNRLDVEEPGNEVWEKISQGYSSSKKISYLYKLSIAASVMICVLSGLYFLVVKNDNKGETVIVTKQSTATDLVNSTVQTPDTLKIQSAAASSLTVPDKKKQPAIASTKIPTRPIKPYSIFDDLDKNFQYVINKHLFEIRTTPFYAEGADYFSNFKKELTILSKEEKTLKMDVEQLGMNEETLDRLISIYQSKVWLLKKLRIEIQKMNNRVKQSDPGINTRKPVYINM